MAVPLNKVYLMGNLTADPALRYTPGGAAVCELRMAINRTFMSSSGQPREEVTFVDVTVWNKTAENCQRFLAKGSPVFVEGRLQLDQWEDRETGKRSSRLRVVADSVQFLSTPSRRDGAAQDNSNGYQNQPRQQYAPRQFNRDNSYQQGGAPRQFNRDNAPARGNDYDNSQRMPEPMEPVSEDPYIADAEDDIPF